MGRAKFFFTEFMRAADFKGVSHYWRGQVPENLRLANCYIAHDSSGFPLLLPFCDAPSGRGLEWAERIGTGFDLPAQLIGPTD
jgi:hypothetical protein